MCIHFLHILILWSSFGMATEKSKTEAGSGAINCTNCSPQTQDHFELPACQMIFEPDDEHVNFQDIHGGVSATQRSSGRIGDLPYHREQFLRKNNSFPESAWPRGFKHNESLYLEKTSKM